MKGTILTLMLAAAVALSYPAWAHEGEVHDRHEEAAVVATVKASLESPAKLTAMQENTITVKLTNADGSSVTEDQLKEVHTRRVHFLIVDESLADYHHLHPVTGKDPGTYTASFIPHKNDNYKLWVDLTPVNGRQQFATLVMNGEKPCETPCIERRVSNTGTADGLTATLFFKSALKVGNASMGMARITDAEGKPVTDLEPVMGAFAHIVGFYDDFTTAAHIHPMGKEPVADTERGGPDLTFHFEPAKAGFIKLYVQISRDGKDIFIPLGATVE